MVPTVAVLESAKTESAAKALVISITSLPCASYAEEAPAVCVVDCNVILKGKLAAVSAPVVPVAMLVSVMTVPLPHPETVQSFTLYVSDAVEAATVE